MTTTYDSSTDTLEHITNVSSTIDIVLKELLNRAELHDRSKLESFEKPYFDQYTLKLKTMTYGSDEYKQCLKELSVALDHHYKNNRHHPEHFENGIDGMNLIDLIEMFCDWKAATLRHSDGDLLKSLEHNKERFGISDQLYNILKNSINLFE
jgi:hypothetical protein